MELTKAQQNKVVRKIREGARVSDVCDMLGCTSHTYYYVIRPNHPEMTERIQKALEEREEPRPPDDEGDIWQDGAETEEEVERRSAILQSMRRHAVN